MGAHQSLLPTSSWRRASRRAQSPIAAIFVANSQHRSANTRTLLANMFPQVNDLDGTDDMVDDDAPDDEQPEAADINVRFQRVCALLAKMDPDKLKRSFKESLVNCFETALLEEEPAAASSKEDLRAPYQHDRSRSGFAKDTFEQLVMRVSQPPWLLATRATRRAAELDPPIC